MLSEDPDWHSGQEEALAAKAAPAKEALPPGAASAWMAQTASGLAGQRPEQGRVVGRCTVWQEKMPQLAGNLAVVAEIGKTKLNVKKFQEQKKNKKIDIY